MAITVADVEDLIAVLRAHPEWRERVRDELLGAELLRLPGSVDSLNATLQDLSLKMAELAVEMGLLAAAQRRSDERLTVLDERMFGVEGSLRSLDGRVGLLEGSDFERKFRAQDRLVRLIRRPTLIAARELEAYDAAVDSGVIGEQEQRQMAALDHLFAGRDKATGRDVLVAFEVSKRVDRRDVERAAERASILRKAGLEVLAFAGGQRATQGAVSRAAELEVTLILDREAGSDEPSDDPIE